MSLRLDLASIKESLLARLPLTPEQSTLRDELLPLAHKVASNLLNRWARHRWLDKDDIYQHAAVCLEEAIREYDPIRSPDIAGWVGRFVSWRPRTWLRQQLREREGYKPLIRREQPRRIAPLDTRLADEGGMSEGRWDRYGSYRDSPLHRLIAKEIATEVRRAFDPRDVAIYIDKLSGDKTEDVARKHYLTPQRTNQIIHDIREYIQGKLRDTGVPVKMVVAAMRDYNSEGRKQAMRFLGYTAEEIQEKSEKSIF